MGKKILLVGDNADCTEIMQYILEDEGFDVISTESADVIFKCSPNFDLIVIDEFSFGRNGDKVCKELKSDTSTRDVPVMLTSAGMNVKAVAKSCKADAYLCKPFDLNFFTNLVHQAINHNVGRY